MYELPKELKANIEALIREGTFRDVKTGVVIDIVAQLQNLSPIKEECQKETS